MKKKILVALCVVICVISIGVFILSGKGYSPSVGNFLRADSSDMIILGNSPVVMSNRTDNDDIFENYENHHLHYPIHHKP